MHNNYYFLRQLSAELGSNLKGCVVSECFSQNKDELIIRFETASKPFFIKASLLPHFCCLSFPPDFNRARKNSVDLFSDLIGQRVIDVCQYNNERCFSLILSNQYTLLFKLYGNRANLILFHHDDAVALFRNHQAADRDLRVDQLNKNIDWTEEAFQKNLNNLQQHYYTFGKVLWAYLGKRNFNSLSTKEKWSEIQALLLQLEKPTFFITQFNNQLVLSLVDTGEVRSNHTSAIEAVHEFFSRYSVETGFYTEKQAAVSKLQTQLKNSEAYLAKTTAKLHEIEADDHYKTWADIIMANLHQVKTGMDKITLPDFYHENNPVEIKLKKDLNAQKNAEVFYRKSKNHHIEVQKLKEAIAKKSAELSTTTLQLQQLEATENLKDLRALMNSFGLTTITSKKEINLPYHETDFQGYKIWVGKNAKQNDALTLHYTYKEDLWLHAKDVAGSHVVIKYQAGKKFPKEVIERAAQLAAYHSKRKTDSLCPVAVTPKKFVRKRKGDPPGAVVVEKEEVILIEPMR